MNLSDLKEFYRSRQEKFSMEEKQVNNKIIWIGFLRLIFIIVAVFLFIKGVKLNILILQLSGAVFFIMFFRLVSIHKNLSDLKKKLGKLILINNQESEALNGNFSTFYNGVHYLNPEHEFTYDLDIFGEKSLFQYINRSCTNMGEQRLADDFISSPKTKEEIIETQAILKELLAKQEILQDYRSTGLLTEDSESDRNEILSWMSKDNLRFSTPVRFMVYAFSLLNTGLITATVINSKFAGLLTISILLTWFVYGIFLTKINRYHANITKKQSLINKYLRLSKIISSAHFQHESLKAIQSKSIDSLKKLRELDLLMNFLDSRLNLLVGLFLNTVFLHDFHIIMKMEKWKENYRSGIPDFFASHAEFDMLISKSAFSFNHPDFCWPELSEKAIISREMGHPLLHFSKRICSNFSINDNENVILITGANMAGKSTFLRAVGANLILAGMGMPVCAAEFSFSPDKIISGMRTTDSLAESESYFFAELKRLQRIVEGLNKGERYFILLDEILKGTNSTDKHIGSEALIRQLVKTKAVCLIASHDLELGKMQTEFPEKIRNYRFESHIENNELVFDYKLQTGIAQNMNASFLMKKMGIIR
ncbi:MAG: hypothetical protein K9H49_15245 [Bacteroidales bacterium]|nr:hypothetical protein [Bacteroidales bacterium]MCF8391594.1 hypothetical protein [Bacteroidales bacterium]